MHLLFNYRVLFISGTTSTYYARWVCCDLWFLICFEKLSSEAQTLHHTHDLRMQLFWKKTCQLTILYTEWHTPTLKEKSQKCQYLTNSFTVACLPQVKFTCVADCFLWMPSSLQLPIKNTEQLKSFKITTTFQ